MINVDFHRSDGLALVGSIVAVAGMVLPLVSQPAPSTLALSIPWETVGIFPSRMAPVAVIVLYAGVRTTRRFPRVECATLALASLLVVLYPPYRFSSAPVEAFVPGMGFYVTQLGGLLLAAAATLRYVEATGYRADNSATESVGAN